MKSCSVQLLSLVKLCDPVDCSTPGFLVHHQLPELAQNKLWKILKEMGIPDHLSASWEVCMQVKKQQLEPDMKQKTGSILGKEYV